MAVTESQTARDLTRVRFIGKDWDTYVNEINSFIQAAFGNELYNAFVADDVGQMLIESSAYALSGMSWYADRQAGESFLETSEIPFNVSRLARLVGHKAAGAVPATGNVEIALSEPYTFDVVLEEGVQVQGDGGKTYETNQELTFLVGEVGPTASGRQRRSMPG